MRGENLSDTQIRSDTKFYAKEHVAQTLKRKERESRRGFKCHFGTRAHILSAIVQVHSQMIFQYQKFSKRNILSLFKEIISIENIFQIFRRKR